MLENGVLKEMKVDGVAVAIEDGSRPPPAVKGDKRRKDRKVCM